MRQAINEQEWMYKVYKITISNHVNAKSFLMFVIQFAHVLLWNHKSANARLSKLERSSERMHSRLFREKKCTRGFYSIWWNPAWVDERHRGKISTIIRARA